jgi:transcription termination factor Rho
LLDEQELEAVWKIRRSMDRYNNSEIIEKFINSLLTTQDNKALISLINKEGNY